MCRRKNVKALVWTERPSTTVAARSTFVRRARGMRPLNRARRGLQLADGEFKSVDVAISQAVNSDSAVQLLNGISRGDEISERNGREVTMRSIQFDARVTVTSGTGVDQFHRVIIVYDNQTNAAALTAAQVLSVVNVTAPRNLENRRRFRIMMDKKIQLNASGEPGAQRLMRFYRRLRHPITFNSGDAATVADITTGSMYVVVIGTEAAGATAGTIGGSCRIRYQDR